MININAQIIFFAFQKLNAITIVFHIAYQCEIMSEITLNITIHGPNNNGLLTKIIYTKMIAYDKHQCTNHFLCIAEINCNNNCISNRIYQCAFKSEITLNITIHGSNYNTRQCL